MKQWRKLTWSGRIVGFEQTNPFRIQTNQSHVNLEPFSTFDHPTNTSRKLRKIGIVRAKRNSFFSKGYSRLRRKEEPFVVREKNSAQSKIGIDPWRSSRAGMKEKTEKCRSKQRKKKKKNWVLTWARKEKIFGFSSGTNCFLPSFARVCVSLFFLLSVKKKQQNPKFSLLFADASCHLWIYIQP